MAQHMLKTALYGRRHSVVVQLSFLLSSVVINHPRVVCRSLSCLYRSLLTDACLMLGLIVGRYTY